MKKRLGFAACLLGFACLILAGVLAAVNWVGTDAELYYALQMKAGILDSAGISEEDLVKLDAALADSLNGNAEALAVQAKVFGKIQPAFNEKERIHMEDCMQLFLLLRTVIYSAAALGAGLIPCSICLLRSRRSIRLSAWLAPLAIVIPLGTLAVWAVFDFNSAFNFFHEVLFTNDLWLLNPATDLLIRICPASMFMAMGARIGWTGLAWAITVPALTTVFTAKKERI